MSMWLVTITWSGWAAYPCLFVLHFLLSHGLRTYIQQLILPNASANHTTWGGFVFRFAGEVSDLWIIKPKLVYSRALLWFSFPVLGVGNSPCLGEDFSFHLCICFLLWGVGVDRLFNMSVKKFSLYYLGNGTLFLLFRTNFHFCFMEEDSQYQKQALVTQWGGCQL